MVTEFKGMLFKVYCGLCRGKLQVTGSQIYCDKCNVGCIFDPMQVIRFTYVNKQSGYKKPKTKIVNYPAVM